jgi:hypothetical protein
VAKRLKAAVFGQRADNPDESDEDDDSPVTDTQTSSRQDGKQPDSVSAGNVNGLNGSPSIRSPSRNYNTFGWDSDTERATSITEAP